MLGDVLQWGQTLMEQYGLWAILILMFLETALILHGVPTEFIMTLGALPIMHSPADVVTVVIVGTIGATLGSQAVYWASSYGGRPFILRHPRMFRMTEARLDRFDRVFQSPSGAVLVFACRLVPFLRGFVSVPAGLARMNPWLYFTLSTVGAALFNLALAGTTYLTHRVPESPPARAYHAFGVYLQDHWAWLLGVLAVILVLSLLAWRHRVHVEHHYRRHVPPGWPGFLVVAVVVGLVMAAILVAVPAVWRGLAVAETPVAVPAIVLATLIAVAALLAATRHHLAAAMTRSGRRRADDEKDDAPERHG